MADSAEYLKAGQNLAKIIRPAIGVITATVAGLNAEGPLEQRLTIGLITGLSTASSLYAYAILSTPFSQNLLQKSNTIKQILKAGLPNQADENAPENLPYIKSKYVQSALNKRIKLNCLQLGIAAGSVVAASAAYHGAEVLAHEFTNNHKSATQPANIAGTTPARPQNTVTVQPKTPTAPPAIS